LFFDLRRRFLLGRRQRKDGHTSLRSRHRAQAQAAAANVFLGSPQFDWFQRT
jgi:hypothetical protein